MKLLSFLRPVLEAAAVVGVVLVVLRLLSGLFSRKSHVYQPTAFRQFTLLFWPVLCLAVGLPFLVSFFLAEYTSAYELGLLLALAALVLGFSVPAFVLHTYYYFINQHTTLVFDPKQNVLEVYEASVRIPFGKSDIRQVEYVTCRSERLFWSPYVYLRLHLRSGEILTLTSLLVKLAPVAEFLRNTPLEHRQRWLCWP
ncbi:hypothetical protein [Hymenobacter metallilatus]|uniref:PH domain-containing protein n=1 Tax=Hymenobacter metallilatus TaxID=2493666 RepID=A0A3R9NBV7_9BACT|nr:hypothetical protein [Hymenobacter metallilatus]RSK30158.1 hypothetical protein EI290_14995 [Hymenobacter metallilatus]